MFKKRFINTTHKKHNFTTTRILKILILKPVKLHIQFIRVPLKPWSTAKIKKLLF